MSDNNETNQQISHTLQVIQEQDIQGNSARVAGAGKAFQSVSQSSALAVQDATDNLRNVNTMATTAMGVALSQMLATGDVETYSNIIEEANKMVQGGANNYVTIGSSAGSMLGNFPTGN